MTRNRWLSVFVWVSLIFSGVAGAQSVSPVTTPPQKAVAADGVKFKMGFSERIRHEFWRNIFDYENSTKDNRNFFRLKTSLWGQADLDKYASLYLRLTSEFKGYTYFYQSSNKKKGLTGEPNEVVFDNAYVDLKNVFDSPVSLRIGRQDFLGAYGEGFLIMDGTPLDGSRTYYFNAVKTAWQINDKNSVDLIYINDRRTDQNLPIINDLKTPQALNVTEEEAYVLYGKSKAIDHLALEPYYIYKKEDDDGGTKLQAQKGKINTPGFYAKYDMDPFVFRGQVAKEMGSYGPNDRDALGGYFFADRAFKEKKWQPKLTMGYVYLSGDDPSTPDNEGWDPLFSRWPIWSELYLLSYNSESGLGYWTNLQMERIVLELNPSKKFKAELFYNYLRANENATGAMFGDGKNRGHLPQCKFTYTFNSHVSTYFLAEYLIPGNFYADTADPALFFRTEVMVKF